MLTGLGTPNQMRKFVKDGTVEALRALGPGQARRARRLRRRRARLGPDHRQGGRDLRGRRRWARTRSATTAWSCSASPPSSTRPTSTSSTSRASTVAAESRRGTSCRTRLLPAPGPPGPARRVPRAPPRRLAGDARGASRRPAGATTRSSCATTACWSATCETEDFEAAQRAMEATDVNARWQAEMAAFFDGADARPRARAPRRRSSTLTDALAFAAIDLGAVERPRRRSAASTASASRSRSSTASPTGPCGCRTGCAGTCCTCSPRRSPALRRRAAALHGVGVDTWGVDYALLDERGRVLGLPFHYRDERTEGMVDRAHARVAATSSTRSPASRRCRSTRVFQLLADEGSRGARGRRARSRSCPTCSPTG